MKSSIFTGLSRQNDSYLAEYIVGECYGVYGLGRRTLSMNYWRIQHLPYWEDVKLLEGDMTDEVSSKYIHYISYI